MLWRPALASSPCSLDWSADFCSGKAMKGCFQKSKAVQRFAGVCLAIIVTLTSTAIPLGILILAHWIHPALHFVIASVFCYQMLAAKSLKTESMKVYDQLEQHNIEGARKAVSMIVGRDTANLTEEQVAKAAVETVAENTSDGVIAPFVFYAHWRRIFWISI